MFFASQLIDFFKCHLSLLETSSKSRIIAFEPQAMFRGSFNPTTDLQSKELYFDFK